MRLFQVQETASAKALRQEWSWPSEMRQEGRWAREEWTAEMCKEAGSADMGPRPWSRLHEMQLQGGSGAEKGQDFACISSPVPERTD